MDRPVGVRSTRATGGAAARAGGDRARTAAARNARPGPAATTSRSSSTRPRRSRTTSTGATSRSTRWPAGSRTANSSIPTAAARDLEAARPAHGVANELRRRSVADHSRASLRLAARSRSGEPRRSSRCGARPPAIRLVSGERIGGGIAADGWGALEAAARSASCEGARDRARHRCARRSSCPSSSRRSASTRRAATTR